MSSCRVTTLLILGLIPFVANAQSQVEVATPAEVQPPARTDPIPSPSQTERNFVKETLANSRSEIALADLAMDQGADPMVKAFAKMIVDDHNRSNDNLEDIARKKTIETDVEENFDNHLISQTGTEFDQALIKRMILDHAAAIERFKTAEKQITDPELHDFITSTLPILQAHLEQANALSKDIPAKLSEK